MTASTLPAEPRDGSPDSVRRGGVSRPVKGDQAGLKDSPRSPILTPGLMGWFAFLGLALLVGLVAASKKRSRYRS